MKFEFSRVNPASPFAQVASGDWNNWAWQLRQSLKKQQDFSRVFNLTPEESIAFQESTELFNIRTTPYYASLCSENPQDPIRKILMPAAMELTMGAQSQLDPLGEKKNNPAPRIIHRYPDRVLFLVTDICSVYCRYCTRKHFTGQEQAFLPEEEYTSALEYIRNHRGVREVILSGGDPLTLSDSQIFRILKDLRSIEHVEIIRIGTRMPVVCPMRITTELVAGIRQFQPVYMMTHFNHPKEISLQAKLSLDLIADAGIPIFNQMVLLRGVNNHPAVIQALSRRLLYLRVKPYYMFQCDPSEGTDHLRTSLEESEEIQRELWGHLSGLAMPNLSVDVPSGGGKVALVPDFEVHRDSQSRTYRGFDGVIEDYRNPNSESRVLPLDFIDYEKEWQDLKSAKFPIKSVPDEHILPQIF